MTLLVHLDVRVAENERRSDQPSLWIEQARYTRGVLRKIPGQQRHPVVEDAHAAAEDGLAIAAWCVRHAGAWSDGRGLSNGLAGEAQAYVQSQTIVKHPVVLGEGGAFAIFYGKNAQSREVDSLRHRAIRPLQQHRVRLACSGVGPADKVGPELHLVPAPPLQVLELVGLEQFLLAAGSMVPVEEISVPAVGRDQHIQGPLAVGIAVELRVLDQSRESAARAEQVAVGGADRIASLPVIGGRGLRDQGIDVGKFPLERKGLHVDREQVLRRESVLEAGKRVDPFSLGFVMRPGQASHRLLVHFVDY